MAKTYPTYKPTRLEWLPEVPEHWEVKALKYAANLKSGDAITSDNIRTDGAFVVYGGNGIRGYTEKYTHSGEYILIGRQGALCGNIKYATGNFFASEHAVVATVISGNSTNYLGELLDSMNLNQYSQASAQPGLSVEKIQNLKIPVPPSDEQAAIADYLDEQTARIDGLIKAKTDLIDLLREERIVFINNAVSGEGKGWERKKLKHVASVNPAFKKYKFEKNSEEEVVFLPMEKVSEDGKVNQKTRRPIYEVSSGFTYFEKGDVIVAKITPCFENGKAAMLDDLETEFGFGSTEFHTLRATDRINSKFLFSQVKTHSFMAYGEASMVGSAGQKRVPTSFAEDFIIALPSLQVQPQIVQQIQTETSRIDALISKIEDEIRLVQEYRATLISECVTGRRKVPLVH